MPNIRVAIPARKPPYHEVRRTAPKRKRKGVTVPKIAFVPKKRNEVVIQEIITRP